MHDIAIHTVNGRLELSAPYNPEAKAGYHGLDGRWDPDRRVWKFPPQVLKDLRNVLVDHFGHDDQPTVTRTVRLTLHGNLGPRFTYFAREIARRWERDEPVKLGQGVRRVEGQFDSRGGSRAKPRIGDVEGIVLEVRGVPEHLIDTDDEDVEIVPEPVLGEDEVAALLTEREELVHKATEIAARITEIDAAVAAAQEGAP